jgi:ELWxxDGT repeat protein
VVKQFSFLAVIIFCVQLLLGQSLVKDINIGSGGSNPSHFTRFGNQTCFIANDGEHGYELWITDGTDAGTTLVKDISPGMTDGCFYHASIFNKVSSLQVLGKNIYFFANDGIHGFELWRSDGTELGTTMVKDILPGAASCSVDLSLIRAGNYLYFAASDALHGTEIWKSDGTDTGTILLKDIYPGPQSSNPLYLFADNDTVYFAANDKITGYGLWKTDGTEDGTVFLKNVAPSGDLSDSMPYIKFKGQLYFSGLSLDNGTELWKTDGTPGGTVMVKDINPGKADGSPLHFNILKDRLVFSAITKQNGKELWQSDGTDSGTTLIKDIYPGKEDSDPGTPVVLGDKIYFIASDSAKRTELWVSDLSDTGTHIFYPTQPGVYQHFKNLFGDKDAFYFTTDSANTGFELWRSDGTPGGTKMMHEICNGTCSSEPGNFYKSDTILFFSAYDDLHGNELWSIGSNVTFIDQVVSRADRSLHTDPLRKELDRIRNTGSEITYIKIFDLAGNDLYTQLIKDPNHISSENLKPGIYVLRAYDKLDEAVSFTRFIKE